MRSQFVVVVLVSAFIGAAGTARSEDFTGFYAGVNAGYAFGKGKRNDAPAEGITSPKGTAPPPGLPPSALNAARAMKSPTRATKASPLLR